MINEALNYLQRASIIPLNGKIPALASWKEFQTRKATIEEVTEWWTKNPNYNIGIVTGKLSNITVVDVDQEEIPAWLPKTAMAKTGKGWHFYYQYEQGVANSARVRENIDIRGEGGYVVAPPSIHPQTGKAYAWVTKGNIQPFPSSLFGVAKTRTNWDEMANGAPEGQRNESAAKYIGKLMQVFSPQTWENTVWETAKIWNQKNNPPLDESELRHTYESIQAREIQKDRAEEPEEIDVQSLITLDDVQPDPADGIRYSTGIDGLDYVLRKRKAIGSETQGGFAKRELVTIAGRPGHGKTLLASQITVAMQEQGIKSMWFSYEMGLNDLKEIFQELGSDNKMIYCVKLKEYEALMGNVDWIEEHVLNAIKEKGIQMVVIDNLDFLETRAKKDSNFSMNQQAFLSVIVTELTRIAVKYNIIVILLAHVRKPVVVGSIAKRPHMYDIAGTSAVERLCAVGLIVDRETRIDPLTKQEVMHHEESDVYLDKNRTGGIRKRIKMRYDKGKLYESHDQKIENIQEMLKTKETLI